MQGARWDVRAANAVPAAINVLLPQTSIRRSTASIT